MLALFQRTLILFCPDVETRTPQNDFHVHLANVGLQLPHLPLTGAGMASAIVPICCNELKISSLIVAMETHVKRLATSSASLN